MNTQENKEFIWACLEAIRGNFMLFSINDDLENSNQNRRLIDAKVS